MAGENGYHILYLARNQQAWICPDRVGRRQPNDPLEFPTANHFLTRAAANDYIRRRDWQAGLQHRVEACTWGDSKKGGCLRAHLADWLVNQDPAQVEAWEQARRSLATAKSARRRDRAAQRKAAFQQAVDAEVTRRLAELGIDQPTNAFV